MKELRKIFLISTIALVSFTYREQNEIGFILTSISFIIYITLIFYPIISKKKRFSKAQIKNIDKMSGIEFEKYTKFLLEELDYKKVRITKSVGDQGIDVITNKDGIKIGIQCKRHKKNIGNKAIQEVHAGIGYYSLDKGIVLTNSYFTNSARTLANKLDVELWDRKKLIKLIENTKK